MSSEDRDQFYKSVEESLLVGHVGKPDEVRTLFLKERRDGADFFLDTLVDR